MKNDQRHKYLELCIPYLLGRLTAGNRKQFEAHLKSGCQECTRELAELQDALSLVPLMARQQTPPSRVKSRLFTTLSAGGRAPASPRTQPEPIIPPHQRPWFGYAVAAVFLLVVIVLGIYTNDLISTIGVKDQLIVELRDELQRREEILKVLQSPKIDVVLMNGLEPNPAGYGKIIWDPAKKVAIFQVSNLPTVPQDKDYQLWTIKDNKPVNAGVFAVTSEKEKEAFFKVINLAVSEKKDIDAFAVTLEPKGGVPQPTGKMYLLGSTSSSER